ncbi:hypothetical protein DOY81_002046 [Sarcophaga bullata]|nr:hypothetical protein DOY81_002046 [Sarcophaga bullata]
MAVYKKKHMKLVQFVISTVNDETVNVCSRSNVVKKKLSSFAAAAKAITKNHQQYNFSPKKKKDQK